jgi:hypothetical protein
LSKAEVRITELWKDSFCEKPERVSFTDDKGRFEIASVNTFRLFKPILGDPLFGWNLCIIVEGKTYVGSAWGGVGFSPPSIVLRCTLKSVYTNVEAAEVNKFGICTAARFIRHGLAA